MTLPHGENKLPLLYRQISLKVFKEDSQAVNFVDDIGGEIWTAVPWGSLDFCVCATHLFNEFIALIKSGK